jgi:hypothetical protein
MRRALEAPGDYPVLKIRHPIAGAVMPLNMPAPVVSWIVFGQARSIRNQFSLSRAAL